MFWQDLWDCFKCKKVTQTTSIKSGSHFQQYPSPNYYIHRREFQIIRSTLVSFCQYVNDSDDFDWQFKREIKMIHTASKLSTDAKKTLIVSFGVLIKPSKLTFKEIIETVTFYCGSHFQPNFYHTEWQDDTMTFEPYLVLSISFFAVVAVVVVVAVVAVAVDV